jgi:V8-like Glu-specific endopeptidase
MKFPQLTLTTTIVLLASIATAIAQPANTPSLTIASDARITDLPNPNQSTVPTNRLKSKAPSVSRGILCKPSQIAEDCDDRVPMRSNDYPWSAIGRLQIGDDGHCTGTLIDESWVLTNAHCVIDSKTHQITTEPLAFLPNLIDGKLQSDDDRAQVIKVIAGTDFSDSDVIPNPNDWAIVKLDRPLGKTYGTIGWKAIPSTLLIKNTRKFTLAGYSSDFPNTEKYSEFTAGPGLTAGLHQSCSITGEQSDKVLIHNCDMRAGASGSAILGWINDEPYIVAINNAEWANRRTNVGYENYAVNVSRIDEWLAKQQSQK